MYRIAETGDVNDPTPVDNIMRMAEDRQRQQQVRPQSAWGRFKNFAGSNAGRTLLGGLGAGLGVALTGGNLQDALGYGVIGAGNTVDTLNQNRQYANRLALKQQERADALAKEQRDRDFRTDMFNRQIEAQKEAANAAFERTLQQLAIRNQYAKERDNLAREWAVEDRDAGQAFTREGWANAARQNELGREFQANQAEEARSFADKQALQNRGWALEDDARNNGRYWKRLEDSRDYAARQLQDQRDYDAALLSSQRAYDEGLYDRRKEDERRYAADLREDVRAYEAGLRAEERNRQLEDEERRFQNDLALLMAKQSVQNAGYQPGDVVNGYVMTGNKKYDDAYLAQAGKNAADQRKTAANAEKNYQTAVHNLNIMFGSEFYDQYNNGFSASGSGAATDDFKDLGLTDAGEGKRQIDSNHSRYRILSYFGRLNYDYEGKYLFSGVFRSLLGKNRWGFFPGVSGGWVFTKEDFVKESLPFLYYGKLRASYGLNGNASGIGPYTLQGSYNSNKYHGNNGFLVGTLPNPSLRWEKTASFDIGLNVGLLGGRLNLDIDYYNRLTSDKYADFTLPSTTGFSSVKNNNGKLRNSGIELQLSGKVLDVNDFTWDASFNITYNKNKIIALPDNGQVRNRQNGQQVYTGRKVVNPGTGKLEDEKVYVGGFQEGMEYGILVGYQAEGIYRSVDDIPGNLVVTSGNIQGKYQYGPEAWNKLSDNERAKGIELKPGDVKWKDVNGDGVIDQYDQVVIGNTTPRWYGGFNTTMSWKGLSLYARFDFALDYWVYDDKTPWFLGCMQGTYNTTKDVFNTWSESNPNAKYPRYVFADQVGAANYYRTSTLFASKGNYLGIRELSLSYTLPQELSKRLYMQKLQFSITGQNLGYLTSARTVSPEISSGYPLPRTVIFGVNVTF